MLKKTQIIRKFRYNGMDIPDVNPAADLDTVLRVLSATYPELTNGKIEPAEVTRNVEKGKDLHTFAIRSVPATKG